MVPLSDREQQILAEIEKGLYEEDPRFARGVAQRSRYDAGKALRSGIVLFLAGFGSLIAFFVTQSLLFGVLGFAAMVAGIVLTAGGLRGSLARRSPHARARVAGALGRWEQRFRDRYKRR